MINYKYDIAVIGAGHAGIEAALAGARLNCKTAIFTINMDSVGNCPCNPSIGGTAKGHLVREVDALGGDIGKSADYCLLQMRMLNKGKGPAVHSLRAQIDRRLYSDTMKEKLEKQKNLDLRQAEIVDIRKENNYWILTSKTKIEYSAKTVIIATGTYLGGRIYIGDINYQSGPDGTFPSISLLNPLKKLGLELRRFKTGTPARILKSSIDFSKLTIQHGDVDSPYFSYDNLGFAANRAVCHIGYTNEKTKRIILENLSRSPLYQGEIVGQGPRYCPSIEDKIVRFKDKERHQIFIEPCGLNTEEMYIQGMSSSLPEDVQIKLYQSVEGLENSIITRPAYAIEYDCVDPLQMDATLEFIDQDGLYGAGQFNGSSGYEEAAAQGIVAGINAALKVKGEKPFVLDRSSSYIGTLIDDLVTKGVSDPYRMMTSRSEYRLILRQDNADERLTPLGRKVGLIDDNRWNLFKERQALKESELKRISTTTIPPSNEVNSVIVSRETSPITEGTKLIELLKRPQLSYKDLTPIDKTRPDIDSRILDQVEIEIKYEGYIGKQLSQVKKMQKLEEKTLSKNLDYNNIRAISLESREKLSKIRPKNIGQASRISGVSPADISVLLVYLDQNAIKGMQND